MDAELPERSGNITYLNGDATRPDLSGGLRVLPHICNNIGGWGSGYVLALSARWDGPERRYRQWSAHCKGDLPLGLIQTVPVKDDDGSTLFIANMVAQQGVVGPDNPRPVDYEALFCCLSNLASWIRSYEDVQESIHRPGFPEGTTIHMPRIGCGLGGGNWEIVELLIRTCLSEYDVFVYDLPDPQKDQEIADLAQVIEENA